MRPLNEVERVISKLDNQDDFDGMRAVEALVAEVAQLREALRKIVALDDEDPGFSASPDWYAGTGAAASIAKEALDG